VIARLQTWWRGLGRRERTLIAAGGGLLGAALVYVIAIEPAWKARARLFQELPRLQAQVVELESLREEARLLKQQGLGRDSAGSIRAEAERSLARAGLPAAIDSDSPTSVRVKAASVQAHAWFAWIEAFTRESRLRVTTASVARSTPAGMVRAEAVFEVPAR
jgi:general secretion pathway protein M